MKGRPSEAPKIYLERDTSKYVIDGTRVPSVTEVLAIAGVIDFGGVPAHLLEAAAERGRAVHRVTALYDLGENPEKDASFPRVAGYLDAYKCFRRETRFSPTLCEHSVVSNEHRYAGTLDRLGKAKAACVWLVDLKTGTTLPAWVGLQLAGYELPARALVGTERIKRIALRLKADGRYTMTPYESRQDFPDFLAAVRLAHWKLTHQGITLP